MLLCIELTIVNLYLNKSGNCPSLWLLSYGENRIFTRLGQLSRYSNAMYGEFVDFSGSFKVPEGHFLDGQNRFLFRIGDVNVETDITIDDFRIELPPANFFSSSSNDICNELILNGDAEGLDGFSHYPMESSSYISIAQDEGSSNRYFKLSKRSDRSSSMQSFVDPNCLSKGDMYLFSVKARIHSESARAYEIQFDGESDYKIVHCPAQKLSDGWVTCSGEVIISEIVAGFTEVKWELNFVDDGITVDIDFDDMSLKNLGFVSKLVVSKEDAQCWGEGSKVHISSSLFYSFNAKVKNGDTVEIKSVQDNSDGTMTIELDPDTTPIIPIITSETNPIYAADAALVSRNVIIQGESEENNKGE